MAERLSESELERTLGELGERLAYPRRDLWPAVRTRISGRRARGWWSWPTLVPVAATLALLLAVTLALTPDLVAYAERVLGLPGVQIYRVPERPTPAPSPLELFGGTRVNSLADATKQVGFAVRAPAELGDPDAVYVETAPARVTLVYRSPGAGERAGIPVSQVAGVSAIVVEFRGTLDQNVIGKAVGPGTTLEPVSLTGGSGFWLAGAPHQFFYRDSSGNFVPETLRLAENTLLWEQGGVTYRLEAQIAKERALRIATSFR